MLVGKQLHAFTVTVPAQLAAERRYPLVFERPDDAAFVVHARDRELWPAITAFMRAKYPIADPPAR